VLPHEMIIVTTISRGIPKCTQVILWCWLWWIFTTQNR